MSRGAVVGQKRLYLDARDRELLAQHNITHILSIHDTAAPILEVTDARRYLLLSSAVLAAIIYS
uniref:Uncharacterized protein n=1 Tax=Lates calcarifer TaxID=8187 RepID=A0A4W6FB66_LATCA